MADISNILNKYQKLAASEMRGNISQLIQPQSIKIRAGKAGGLPFNALVTDVVSGCLCATAACYGACWAMEEAYQKGIDPSTRVPNELDETLLRSDLKKMPKEQGHVRCGWNSDPSWDWKKSAEIAEIVNEFNMITLFLTKAFYPLSPEITDRMVTAKAEMWVGMGALDTDANIGKRFEFMEAYRRAGGVSVPILLVSAYGIDELTVKQDRIAKMIIDHDFPGAENCMRARADRAMVKMGIMDANKSFLVDDQDPPRYWSGRFYSDRLIVPTTSSLIDTYRGGISAYGSKNDPKEMEKLFVDRIPTRDELATGKSASKPSKAGVVRSWDCDK